MRLSPIRSFRTGFGKTSQLVATELFESLHLSGAVPKAVVFSDSRQDAANAALDIERRHHQDMRRQVLVEVARAKAVNGGARRSEAEIRREMASLLDQSNFDPKRMDALSNEMKSVRSAGEPNFVAMKDITERGIGQAQGNTTSPLVSRFVHLGMHPTDDTGLRRIALFTAVRPSGVYEWRETVGMQDLTRARTYVIDDLKPLVDEVVSRKPISRLRKPDLAMLRWHLIGVKAPTA